jgi:triacylglycerol lipase
VYELEDPKNFVFDVNVTGLGYIEQDVYREAGIDYLVDVLWPPSVEA